MHTNIILNILMNCLKFMEINGNWHKIVFFILEDELQQEDEEEDEGGDRNDGAGSMLAPGTDVINSGDVGVLFLEHLEQAASISDRTDFTNFRSLLWRAMSQFPDRLEPRSRELSPLLLRFIKWVCACLHVCVRFWLWPTIQDHAVDWHLAWLLIGMSFILLTC